MMAERKSGTKVGGCGIMISEKEQRLLELIHKIGYGQVVIYLEAGQPVRIEKIKESIKL